MRLHLGGKTMPKLQFRKIKDKQGSYYINLPKQIVENVLMWKQGDNIRVIFLEYQGKKGLFLYREEEK